MIFFEKNKTIKDDFVLSFLVSFKFTWCFSDPPISYVFCVPYFWPDAAPLFILLGIKTFTERKGNFLFSVHLHFCS